MPTDQTTMNNKPVLLSFEFDAIKFRDGVSKNNVTATQQWVAFADIETRTNAMGDAAYHGHLECLKVLAEYVDPRNNQSWGLMAAVAGYNEHGNLACFEFLSPLSNEDDALDKWIEIYGETDNILLSQKRAREQKKILEDQLLSQSVVIGKKKGKKI